MTPTASAARCRAVGTLIATMSDGGLVGRVLRATSSLIVIDGLDRHVSVGTRLVVQPATSDVVPIEVVRIDGDGCAAMPIGQARGVRVGDMVLAPLTAAPPALPVSSSWLGRVIGPRGRAMDRRGVLVPGVRQYPIHAAAIPATERSALGMQMASGVKALDLFVPCRFGQRLGVFAGTGVGKSSLMLQLAEHTECDIVVVALIGERGREVNELVAHLAAVNRLEKSVVVVATSDMTGFEKRDAAYTAVTIAEHFRDDGARVLLLFDSVSRFCDAMREVALAGGELPSAMGFPPSVFQNLAQLLERVGPGSIGRRPTGYVTGVFTTLLDGGEEVNPVADAVRGMLDGHVFLSRRLANRGQYPAIDVMASISRCGVGLFSPEEEDLLREARARIGAYEEAYDATSAGLHRKGQDLQADKMIDAGKLIAQFLRQSRHEAPVPVAELIRQLHPVAAVLRQGLGRG